MLCPRKIATSKIIHAALFSCLFFSVAGSAQEAAEVAFSATQWRTGEMIISESTANSDGWLTLDCEGSGCKTLLDTIEVKLPANEHRRAGSHLEVRAQPWHKERLTHYGPFRAAELNGGLAGTQFFWLDTRHAAVECRWADDAGTHLIKLAGGTSAAYTSPAGDSNRLTLENITACTRCRSLNHINLYLSDPDKPKAGTLAVLVHFSVSDKNKTTGFASWPNQQSAKISCTFR